MLSLLIYPTEFNALVNRLKERGRLDRKTVTKIHGTFYEATAWLLLILSPLLILPTPAPFKILYLVLCPGFAAWHTRGEIRRRVMPYSAGTLRKGIVTDGVHLHFHLVGHHPVTRQHFKYRLIGDDLPDDAGDAEYIAMNIPKRLLPNPPYATGDVIDVIALPDAPMRNMPYLPGCAELWRIDTTEPEQHG